MNGRECKPRSRMWLDGFSSGTPRVMVGASFRIEDGTDVGDYFRIIRRVPDSYTPKQARGLQMAILREARRQWSCLKAGIGTDPSAFESASDKDKQTVMAEIRRLEAEPLL